LLAGGAGGALLVVALPLRVDLLRGEDPATAPRTILLLIRRLYEPGVARLQIHVRGPDLRPVVLVVAHAAVDPAVRAVVVLQRIKHGEAFRAPEAVLVVPLPVGRHHLLRLEDLALALGAAVLAVLVPLDDPGLDGGAGQHVVVVVVEFGQVARARAEQFAGARARSRLGSKIVGIAGLAVDFAVGTFAAGDRVQLSVAFNAGEAVFVEGSHLGGTLLCLEDLARAARTGIGVASSAHDRLRIHPALVVRLGSMAVQHSIAVAAEYFAFGTVEEGRVQAGMALKAGKAVLVVGAALGIHPLGLEDLVLAPEASILIGLLCGEGCLVPILVATAWSVMTAITDLAVDLVVRTLDGEEVVQLMATLDAGKAFLVIEAALCDHLLGLEDLAVAFGTAFSFAALAGNHRHVRGDNVPARPGDLMAADVAVQVPVRPDGGQINAYRPGAVAASHALLVIEPSLDFHLFRGENGAVAARAALLLIGCRDLGRVCEDERDLVLREGLLVAALAVDLLVRPLKHIVDVLEGDLALGAAEALEMPRSILGQLPLHLKGFAVAATARQRVLLFALDGSHVRVGVRSQRFRRVGIRPVARASASIARRTKLARVTAFAINIPVLTIADVLCPDVLLAGLAEGALLVVALVLRHDALVVEDLAVAAGAGGAVPLLRHDGGGVEELEHVAAGHGVGGAAVLLAVAALADDLSVGGVAGDELVEGTVAVAAGEALLVVVVVQGHHLLRGEYLHHANIYTV